MNACTCLHLGAWASRLAPAPRLTLASRVARASRRTLASRVALALILALSIGIATARADDSSDPHHLVHIEGSGPRTVVFEAGFGDTLEIWQTVQPRVAAKCARTFSYNRAGYLDSDPAADARDAVDIVGELRNELKRRNVEPPYVLVGHSLGGLYMQYFARNYPSDVSGVVLIDSTHWQQGLRVDHTANTPYQSRTAITLYMPLVMRHELDDSVDAGLEVNRSPAAAPIPTIVLSSTRLGPNETPEQRAQAVSLQDAIAADFPGARHVYVEDSGHYIQRDKPDVVVNAIREIAGCR